MENEIKNENFSKTLNLPKKTILIDNNISKREGFFLNKMQSATRYREIVEKNKSSKVHYNMLEIPMKINNELNTTYILNKTLKDIMLRYLILSGYNVSHELDFEMSNKKIKEILRSNVNKKELKKAYTEEVEDLINLARENIYKIKKLGTVIDYNDLNTETLKFNYPKHMISKFWEWYKSGKITFNIEPVNWCTKCQKTQGVANVILKEEDLDNLYVLYKIKQDSDKNKSLLSKIENANNVYIIANTVKPWTLISSEHIAVVKDLDYSILKVKEKEQEVYYIVESSKQNNIIERLFLIRYETVSTIKGQDLIDIECLNPLDQKLLIKVIPASKDYVTLDQYIPVGASIVSGGNTRVDYLISKENDDVKLKDIIDKSGKVRNNIKKFVGLQYKEVNKKVLDILKDNKCLLMRQKIKAKIETCRDCGNDLVYVNEKQWYIKRTYQDSELKKVYNNILSKINAFSNDGNKYIKNEFDKYIKNKESLIVSKDHYGVPIPVVYCAKCSKEILNEDVVNTLIKFFEENDITDYYNTPINEILKDIVHCDECGSTLVNRADVTFNDFFKNVCKTPFNNIINKKDINDINLLIENKSDFLKQIRYLSFSENEDITKMENIDKIMLHETVSDKVKKYDENVENNKDNINNKKNNNEDVITPNQIVDNYGTDILRSWIAIHCNDKYINLRKSSLLNANKMYLRIRKTFKYITSNLYDFNPKRDMIPTNECNDLDIYMYTRLREIIKKVEENYRNINISDVFRTIFDFCENDLCKNYFEAIKFRLYILKYNDRLRRSTQSMMYKILITLVRYLTPIMPITLEYIWSFIWHKNAQEENNIMLFRGRVNIVDDEFKRIVSKWTNIFKIKTSIKKYINLAISKKQISNSLEAKIVIKQKNEKTIKFFEENKEDMLRTLNVSQIETQLSKVNSIIVTKADGLKCQRCGNYSKYLGQDIRYRNLCPICSDVMISKEE